MNINSFFGLFSCYFHSLATIDPESLFLPLFKQHPLSLSFHRRSCYTLLPHLPLLLPPSFTACFPPFSYNCYCFVGKFPFINRIRICWRWVKFISKQRTPLFCLFHPLIVTYKKWICGCLVLSLFVLPTLSILFLCLFQSNFSNSVSVYDPSSKKWNDIN